MLAEISNQNPLPPLEPPAFSHVPTPRRRDEGRELQILEPSARAQDLGYFAMAIMDISLIGVCVSTLGMALWIAVELTTK